MAALDKRAQNDPGPSRQAVTETETQKRATTQRESIPGGLAAITKRANEISASATAAPAAASADVRPKQATNARNHPIRNYSRQQMLNLNPENRSGRGRYSLEEKHQLEQRFHEAMYGEGANTLTRTNSLPPRTATYHPPTGGSKGKRVKDYNSRADRNLSLADYLPKEYQESHGYGNSRDGQPRNERGTQRHFRASNEDIYKGMAGLTLEHDGGIRGGRGGRGEERRGRGGRGGAFPRDQAATNYPQTLQSASAYPQRANYQNPARNAPVTRRGGGRYREPGMNGKGSPNDSDDDQETLEHLLPVHRDFVPPPREYRPPRPAVGDFEFRGGFGRRPRGNIDDDILREERRRGFGDEDTLLRDNTGRRQNDVVGFQGDVFGVQNDVQRNVNPPQGQNVLEAGLPRAVPDRQDRQDRRHDNQPPNAQRFNENDDNEQQGRNGARGDDRRQQQGNQRQNQQQNRNNNNPPPRGFRPGELNLNFNKLKDLRKKEPAEVLAALAYCTEGLKRLLENREKLTSDVELTRLLLATLSKVCQCESMPTQKNLVLNVVRATGFLYTLGTFLSLHGTSGAAHDVDKVIGQSADLATALLGLFGTVFNEVVMVRGFIDMVVKQLEDREHNFSSGVLEKLENLGRAQTAALGGRQRTEAAKVSKTENEGMS